MTGINWSIVEEAINKKKKCYAFDEVSHLFRKVAFDAYKPLSGSDQLWELRDGEDGKQYLYALYEEGEDIIATASAPKEWSALVDSSKTNITLSYKSFPIIRFAASDCGYSPAEAQSFALFLEGRTKDAGFVGELLANLSDHKRSELARLMNAQGDK